MHKRTFNWGICVLAIVLIASATDLWAQDGQGYAPSYSATDQARVPDEQPTANDCSRPTKHRRKCASRLQCSAAGPRLLERGFGEAGCGPGKAVGKDTPKRPRGQVANAEQTA